MRLRTDHSLRSVLHELYVTLFRARQGSPQDFSYGRITTIMTALMGIENCGWRVVGITREALVLLATQDFNKNKLPRRLCRGHIVPRAQTNKLLFEGEGPLALEQFFEVFLHNDRTVIMLNEQNGLTVSFPEFVAIDNEDSELFPNGSLMAWKHRKKEREFLRQLHAGLPACPKK